MTLGQLILLYGSVTVNIVLALRILFLDSRVEKLENTIKEMKKR